MSEQRRNKEENLSPLYWPERYLHFSVTVATITYIIYCVYRDSEDYTGKLHAGDFEPGWSWLGKEQDVSNFEWRFWYRMFFNVCPWYIGHVILSQVIRWGLDKYKKQAFLIYSVVSLVSLMGSQPVCLYVSHYIILYTSSLLGITTVVWITSLGLLSTLNFEPFISLMKGLLDDDEEETQYYLLMFTLALINIRSTSFCLEKCWAGRKDIQAPGVDQGQESSLDPDRSYQQLDPDKRVPDKKGTSIDPSPESTQLLYSLQDGVLYIFYLPLFFTGPILTYDKFRLQICSPEPNNSSSKMSILILHVIRFIFWALFNEFLLHFLYFNALQHSGYALQSVSLFTLCGLGYCHGQFFMIKYLVMFGLPATIARMDFLDPPAGPKCISYIYLYSDMWKYFDRGLYSFLKRYIYVACGGSQSGVHRQILGSLLCFMFIFYWHGAEYYILLWILLNYLGVTLEKVGTLITSISFVRHIEGNILSAGMVQRLHALCSIPIFLVSCFSMYCFFGGQVVGHIFFKRLILEGTSTSFLVLVVLLYCAIQNAAEINRWLYGRSNKKVN